MDGQLIQVYNKIKRHRTKFNSGGQYHIKCQSMTLFKCVKCKLAAQCETKSQGIFFSLSLFNALHSVWRKDIKNVLSSQVICSDRKKNVFDIPLPINIPILRSFLVHFLQRFPLISLLQTGKDIVIFCQAKQLN